jgi:hypothetical protein
LSGGDHRWFKRSTGEKRPVTRYDDDDNNNNNNNKYAAATIMTQTLNEPSKQRKNRRNVKFWKIRLQKWISS